MAIIMGDIHGHLTKAQAFLAYQPETEHVCLGDYVDSFTEPPDRQLQCLKLLLASNAVLLWGNHDLHYLPNAPWLCSGYQPMMAPVFAEIFTAALKNNRLKAAHAVDGWLCTHAGLHPQLTDRTLTAAAAAHLLNQAFIEQLEEGDGPLLNVSPGRGGQRPYGGILWFDPFREEVTPSKRFGKQLFGHTEGKQPHVTEDWICMDTTNSPLCWVYDTKAGRAVDIEYQSYP